MKVVWFVLFVLSGVQITLCQRHPALVTATEPVATACIRERQAVQSVRRSKVLSPEGPLYGFTSREGIVRRPDTTFHLEPEQLVDLRKGAYASFDLVTYGSSGKPLQAAQAKWKAVGEILSHDLQTEPIFLKIEGLDCSQA